MMSISLSHAVQYNTIQYNTIQYNTIQTTATEQLLALFAQMTVVNSHALLSLLSITAVSNN
jgi:hypothetical protein